MVPISRVIMYLHFPGLWKKKRTKEALRREMDFHFTIDTFANKSRNKADPQVEFPQHFLDWHFVSPSWQFPDDSFTRTSFCRTVKLVEMFPSLDDSSVCPKRPLSNKETHFVPVCRKTNESNDRRQMCWPLLLRLTNIKYQVDTCDVLPVRKKER